MDETWKDIKGWEKYYQISSLGRVKSKKRTVPYERNGATHLKTYKEKIMSISHNVHGYCVITLEVKPIKKQVKVHRLVAIAFLDNNDDKETVNHIDGDKNNNRLSNLEFSTMFENNKHAVDTGLRDIRGDKNKRAVLRSEDIPKIRKLILSGKTTASISREYNVNWSTIYAVKKRKTWGHAPGPD